MPFRFAPRSLRGRMMAIALVVAVVPLSIIGLRVSNSVRLAGEGLLRGELEESSERVASALESRWQFRRGDLGLLASNVITQRLVTGDAISAEDSAYLRRLFTGLSAIVAVARFEDTSGRLIATFGQQPPNDSTAVSSVGGGARGPMFSTRVPVLSADSDTLGHLTASLRLSGLLPSNTALQLPNNALLQVIDRGTGLALLPSTMPGDLLREQRFDANGEHWLAVRRSVVEPTLDLVVAGPRGRYVVPFQAAARKGAIAIAFGALLAILLSTYLARRVTSSLETLAEAATAVAGGELERQVNVSGSIEVQRVAVAFNSMTDSLRRTLGALSQRQALAAVGELTSGLAHEVRNAMTSIRVDLQLMNEKMGNHVEARPLIDRALGSLKRLDGSVTSSLRIARAGRTPRRTLDLKDVVASSARGAESAFTERGARLQLLNDGDLSVRVRGDPLALEQMFVNLFLNSAQALSEGGVAQVRIAVDAQTASVVIEDNGSGIAPDDLGKVLDPFYSTRGDGTGLGLPIARQVATTHGGSLGITSEIGRGTRVEVTLPVFGASQA